MTKAITPYQELRTQIMSPDVQAQFAAMLGERGPGFLVSVLNIVGQNESLAKCTPVSILRCAATAASYGLSLDPAAGQAYPVPFYSKKKKRHEATFIIGYKGLVQLALRTWLYKIINYGGVYEGQEVIKDQLTGLIEIEGEQLSDKVIGYFAYIETIKGYQAADYMTVEEIADHAKRYSKSYTSGPWANPDERPKMEMKTVLRRLLTHKALLSNDPTMARALAEPDEGEFHDPELEDEPEKPQVIDGETGEIVDADYDTAAGLMIAGRPMGDMNVDELTAIRDFSQDETVTKAAGALIDRLIDAQL